MSVHITVPEEKLENIPKIVIQSFAGSGMVASIVAYHLFDNMDGDVVGFVSLENANSVSIVKNGVAQHQIKIIASEIFGFGVICDIPLPDGSITQIVRSLMEWYQKMSIDEVIVVGGLPTGRKLSNVVINLRVVTNGFHEIEEKVKDYEKLEKYKMRKGIVQGTIAASLLVGKERKIPTIAILAECIPNVADYGAAEAIMAELEGYLDVDVDMEMLHREAQELRDNIRERANPDEGEDETRYESYT